MFDAAEASPSSCRLQGHPDSNSFSYDVAGNMTSRTIAGQATQSLVWDESSRLESITEGASTTGFLYDADGNRVARRDSGVTTVMIDNTFEWSSAGGLVKYYSHGGQVIAMRDADGLHWMFGDHLGSNSTVRTAAGANVRQRYLPYGRVRGAASLPTEYGFTGQRLDPSGLMDYNARQYDPVLGRFTSPDTIIPDAADPQSFNRYTYVNNNPANFTDPTGHEPCVGGVSQHCSQSAVDEARDGVNGGSGHGGRRAGGSVARAATATGAELSVDFVDEYGSTVTVRAEVTRGVRGYILRFPDGRTVFVRSTRASRSAALAGTLGLEWSSTAPAWVRGLDVGSVARMSKAFGYVGGGAEAVSAALAVSGAHSSGGVPAAVYEIGSQGAGVIGSIGGAAAAAEAIRQSGQSLPPWGKAAAIAFAGFLGSPVGEAIYDFVYDVCSQADPCYPGPTTLVLPSGLIP